MKNKKGFTLMEVLCVIALLAVITTVATTGIMSLSQKSKENLYCAKIEMLKSVAITYGSKYENDLNNSTEYYNGYKSIKIKLQDLIDSGFLEPDRKNEVLNPIDDSSMNSKEIILYHKNNQIYAYIDNNIC